MGFTLSPVLWRKLPGAKSAGRVQSVCLRLIVEREMEIEAFRAQEFWTVEAVLAHPARAGIRGPADQCLAARNWTNSTFRPPTAAELAVQAVTSRTLTVACGRGEARHPQPLAALHDLDPAARGQPQVRHGRQACMNAAQRLYEAGHITYMRTDGIDMAPEAVMAARDEIKAALRRGLRSRQPAHVQEQGQERAGSA